jgi:hypothetical protein
VVAYFRVVFGCLEIPMTFVDPYVRVARLEEMLELIVKEHVKGTYLDRTWCLECGNALIYKEGGFAHQDWCLIGKADKLLTE